MKPKRIILVRHGESEGNVDYKRYEEIPDYSLKLTSKGVEQAQKAGQEIKKIIGDETLSVYVSPFFRTRQTFAEIKKSVQGNIAREIEDPRIREQEWGHLRPIDENQDIKKERDEYSTFYFRIQTANPARMFLIASAPLWRHCIATSVRKTSRTIRSSLHTG